MYEDKTHAEVIADSTWDGVRLVTMRCTFPRFILAEFNTHRAFSRNSASSRAIPTKKQVAQVRESPFVPTRWPRNQAGMVPFEFFEEDTWHYEAQWLKAAKQAADVAEEMANDGVHKAIASRLLEPFLWHSVIVSSTEWENFFQQRDHPDAQWEMQVLAKAMRKALDKSTPCEDGTHLPFREDMDIYWSPETMMIKSVARCARASYGREMEEKTYEEDVNLVTRLIKGQHWSPTEHCATAISDGAEHMGNFQFPWRQLRHWWRDYLPTIAARVDSEHST